MNCDRGHRRVPYGPPSETIRTLAVLWFSSSPALFGSAKWQRRVRSEDCFSPIPPSPVSGVVGRDRETAIYRRGRCTEHYERSRMVLLRRSPRKPCAQLANSWAVDSGGSSAFAVSLVVRRSVMIFDWISTRTLRGTGGSNHGRQATPAFNGLEVHQLRRREIAYRQQSWRFPITDSIFTALGLMTAGFAGRCFNIAYKTSRAMSIS